MKTQNILCGIVLAMTLALSACGKKEPPAPTSIDINGVKVDMPALQAAFVGAPPELLGPVNEVGSDLRYGMYMKAMQSLDKVSSDPNLSEPQKKIVAQVIDQLKQVINKAGPSR